MTSGFDLDHTSFAVHDAMDWAKRLRRELGAVPIIGEVLSGFRYLLLYVGTADEGARLELLEPVGAGFLTRFLSARGEGPHHLTFTVPDLRDSVRQVRSLGLTVVGESYGYPAWREAFIAPDRLHGTVIQLAQTDNAYPEPRELLASRDRDPATFPSMEGATEPLWWTRLWETTAPVATRSRRLGATQLGSTDLLASRRLFEDVLDGEVIEQDGALDLSWPSGSIRVHRADHPGVTGMTLHGGPEAGITIGSCRLALRKDDKR